MLTKTQTSIWQRFYTEHYPEFSKWWGGPAVDKNSKQGRWVLDRSLGAVPIQRSDYSKEGVRCETGTTLFIYITAASTDFRPGRLWDSLLVDTSFGRVLRAALVKGFCSISSVSWHFRTEIRRLTMCLFNEGRPSNNWHLVRFPLRSRTPDGKLHYPNPS